MVGANSAYPGRFEQGVSIGVIPVMNSYGGEIFWVDSGGGSDQGSGTFRKPFATLDFAIGRCTANNDDQIHIKAGHAENITAAGGITCDVAGVSIYGHGMGSSRPTFTWATGNTSTIVVSAANVNFINIEFVANFLDVVEMFNVGAVAGFGIYKSKIEDTSTILNFVEAVSLESGASDFHFVGNTCLGRSAENDSWIQFEAATDDLEIVGNYFLNTVAQTALVAQIDSAGELTNAIIAHNYFANEEANAVGAHIDTSASSANQGILAYNLLQSIDTGWAAAELQADVTGMGMFENYLTGSVDLQGLLQPTADPATCWFAAIIFGAMSKEHSQIALYVNDPTVKTWKVKLVRGVYKLLRPLFKSLLKEAKNHEVNEDAIAVELSPAN